ncbi:MAG: hypothetical protein ACUVXI_08265 [bacterium]
MPRDVSVELKPTDNTRSNFILVIGGVRKILARAELVQLARIVQRNRKDPKLYDYMLTWLRRERGDILADCRISGSFGRAALERLADAILYEYGSGG